jgi:PhnB protein
MVEQAGEFLQFLEEAFGAIITEGVRRPDGRIGHAQAKIGNSMIMLAEANAMWKAQPASLYLYVENADEVYRRAVAAGATSIMEPADMFYGDRHGGVKDAWGITWWIATHIKDVPADELQRLADEMMKKRAAS